MNNDDALLKRLEKAVEEYIRRQRSEGWRSMHPAEFLRLLGTLVFSRPKFRGMNEEDFFEVEQEEYGREGIDWTYIEFQDNSACVDLIEGKPGVLVALDDTWRMKGPEADAKFLSTIHATFGGCRRGGPSSKNSGGGGGGGNGSGSGSGNGNGEDDGAPHPHYVMPRPCQGAA